MIILKAILAVIVNLIVYFFFGCLATVRKGQVKSVILTEIVGFFLYYGIFAVVTFPIMFTYRPLSLLSYVWVFVVIGICALSFLINAKSLGNLFALLVEDVKKRRSFYIVAAAGTFICVLLVCMSYNFTLDAAYYVANVATSVDTNMINVYDPFTGYWQDHYELRYVFATYSVNDAVVCYLTGIPALVETKTVMSAMVMILANLLYVYICRFFYEKDVKSCTIMYIAVILVNMLFISIYTASNFLMARTYEGKSIVGNISIIAIFVLYMLAVRYKDDMSVYLLMFIVCLGTATVSSTANMVIPAEVFILFTPYVVKNRKFKVIPRLIMCIMPEVIMMLLYVLYVKGFFVIHTYPR